MDVALMDELEMLYGKGLQNRINKTHTSPSINGPPTNSDLQLSTLKKLYSKTYHAKSPSHYEKNDGKKELTLEKKSKQKLHKILAHH